MKTTKHSKKRIRERMGVNKKSVDRVAEKALEKGLSHSETTGSLHRYIMALYFKNKAANNIKIYSNKVFIFSDENLITMLNLPTKYNKAVNKMNERKKETEDEPTNQ